MRAARVAGLTCITGDKVNILLFTASFRLETGLDADVAAMEAHFKSLRAASAKL